MASESECLGSTGGGPDVAQSLELHVELHLHFLHLHHLLCLLHFEKHEQCDIDQLDWELPGQDLNYYYTKGEDVKLSCVGFSFIESFR